MKVQNYVLPLTLFLFLTAPFAFAQPQSALEDTLRKLSIPLIVIETENGEIPTCDYIAAPEGYWGASITNNNYVEGRLCMIQQGDTIYDSGAWKKDKSGMKIKFRGNTTSHALTKSFKIKLQKKADLFFRGDKDYKDKEWALLNYIKSQDLKTFCGNEVALMAGMEYQPQAGFANVMLNDNYYGLYLLSETVKKAKKRVDIDDTGYLIEADAYWWNTQDSTFKTHHLYAQLAYAFKYPKIENQTDSVIAQIRDYINEFENNLYGGGDWMSYIDISSFAGWVLTHDILGTQDAAGANMYLYKMDFVPHTPTSSPLKMGPAWDFDTCFWTASWATIHSLWQFYYQELFKSPTFVKAYWDAYDKLRPELEERITEVTDSVEFLWGGDIDISRNLTYQTWHEYQPQTLAENVQQVKDWFHQRIAWMDEQELAERAILESSIAAPSFTCLHVYNLQGKLVLSVSGADCAAWMHLGVPSSYHLPSGVYILQAQCADGRKFTRKVVINN